MKPHTLRAVITIKECALLNLKKARAAKLAGRERLAAYHLRIAIQCRADANAITR
jgi:hypothetical protein